ncbi:hypothetical protein SAMN02745116_00341 [Pilibacter termitis]|uniref:Uncharacterized protein n=1 Tax=Pilibacter termitis TaxID=263852 RepID=A0A1T4KR85_9ENTE|nr:hypothetical protein [Pilibacter termitis]SJZ44890.1 hypothetical protein SAMN02745116_00341 [Pilibacter termitis]
MDKGKGIEEKLFYRIFSRLYNFLLLNICFTIGLLPLAVLLFLPIQAVTVVLIKLLVSFTYLQLLLYALLYTTKEVVLEQRVKLFARFLRHFLFAIKKKLKMSVLHSLLLLWVSLDIYFVLVIAKIYLLLPFMAVLLLMVCSSAIEQMFEREMNFHVKAMARAAFRKLFVNFLGLLLLGIGVVVFEHHVFFCLLILPSILGSVYLHLRNYKRVVVASEVRE